MALWTHVPLETLHTGSGQSYSRLGNAALFRWEPRLIGAVIWGAIDISLMEANDAAIGRMFEQAGGPVDVISDMSALKDADFNASMLARLVRTGTALAPIARFVLRRQVFVVTVDWAKAFWQGINPTIGLSQVDTLVTASRAEALRWLGTGPEAARSIDGLCAALSESDVLPTLERVLAKDPGADLSAAARALAMSTRSLQRELALHGTSFSTLRTRVRLRIAQERLARTTIKVEAIALEVGFRSVRQFSEAFRRATGHSPNAFRNGRGA